MNNNAPKLTVLALAVMLGACGGGSDTATEDLSSGNVTPTPPAKMGSLIIGTITGFGSVYVDGVRYVVDANTVVAVEDEDEIQGDDSRLSVGMKVKLYAASSDDTKTASRIEYDDDLEGVIESITPDATNPLIGTLIVFGQTVIIDENTAFDSDIGNNDANPGIDFGDLEVGMSVEISGYPTEDGLLATRVERELDDNGNDREFGNPDVDDDEFELKGYVDSVADDLSSIVVNGMTFIITNDTQYEDGLIIDQTLVGAYVEVEADIVNNEYILKEIEREDSLSDDDYEGEFEIEGILQAIDNSTDNPTITINGLVISVNDTSLFEGMVGQRIEVKGSFNDSGVLIIASTEREQEESVKTEDTIVSIDTENSLITTRLGLEIVLTGNSRLEDDVVDEDDNLSVDEFISLLVVGDLVKASAVENADGSYTWTKVKRLDSAANTVAASCELSGYVTEITGDATDFGMYVAGVMISTSRTDNSEFYSDDDNPIGRSAFFEQLQVGMEVEAESFEGDAYCTPQFLDAEKVELESEDDQILNLQCPNEYGLVTSVSPYFLFFRPFTMVFTIKLPKDFSILILGTDCIHISVLQKLLAHSVFVYYCGVT